MNASYMTVMGERHNKFSLSETERGKPIVVQREETDRKTLPKMIQEAFANLVSPLPNLAYVNIHGGRSFDDIHNNHQDNPENTTEIIKTLYEHGVTCVVLESCYAGLIANMALPPGMLVFAIGSKKNTTLMNSAAKMHKTMRLLADNDYGGFMKEQMIRAETFYALKNLDIEGEYKKADFSFKFKRPLPQPLNQKDEQRSRRTNDIKGFFQSELTRMAEIFPEIKILKDYSLAMTDTEIIKHTGMRR